MRFGAMAIAIAAFSAVGSVALAASGLKATMKMWKADAGISAQMASGRAPYDETELRRILAGFVSDAQGIEARLSDSSAKGKDIKLRFARFEADSNAASAGLGKKDQLRSNVAAVISNCKSCHDVYAN